MTELKVKEPSAHLYMHAKQFFDIAESAYNRDHHHGFPGFAIAMNYAFCVEILLKSCKSRVKYYGSALDDVEGDEGEGEINSRQPRLVRAARIVSDIHGHDLPKIFQALDQPVAEKLAKLFLDESGVAILSMLTACNGDFGESRYPYDAEKFPIIELNAVRKLALGLLTCLPKWNQPSTT